jgi:drug/metabolite transporter (DMT)-like permease
MILDRRILFGILFICGAGILFPVMNGFAKFLGSDYNSIQVSWARAFGHIVFMMATFVPRYGLGMLRTRRPVFQVGRSALLSLSNLSFFFAIVYIPIAEAACISLTAPLVVALLAWPLLGERTTKGRLIALGIGFVGVIVVIRPGTELFHWATLGVVVSATSYALYQIMTRMVATVDTPETSAIYSSIFGSFGLLFVMPFVWKTPETLRDISLFCSLGVLGAMGHYFVARALQLAPANVVTPFQYFQLIGSVVVGYFFFGNFPDVLTWVGAAIIVGAGLYIGWSQTRPPASRAS